MRRSDFVDKCPTCNEWWASCPCCNTSFCPDCGMTEEEAEEELIAHYEKTVT